MDRRSLLKFMPGAALAASMPFGAFASTETLEQRRDRLTAELSAVLKEIGEATPDRNDWRREQSLIHALLAASVHEHRHPVGHNSPYRWTFDNEGEFALITKVLNPNPAASIGQDLL